MGSVGVCLCVCVCVCVCVADIVVLKVDHSLQNSEFYISAQVFDITMSLFSTIEVGRVKDFELLYFAFSFYATFFYYISEANVPFCVTTFT